MAGRYFTPRHTKRLGAFRKGTAALIRASLQRTPCLCSSDFGTILIPYRLPYQEMLSGPSENCFGQDLQQVAVRGKERASMCIVVGKELLNHTDEVIALPQHLRHGAITQQLPEYLKSCINRPRGVDIASEYNIKNVSTSLPLVELMRLCTLVGSI